MTTEALVLVSCCGLKLARPAPARELYQSPLFKLARRFAEQSGRPWVILSALHGVVDPEQIIEPYDQRMPTAREAAQAWAAPVAIELQRRAGRFVSLCGVDYTRHLAGLDIEHPLAGLGVGSRLQWLKRATARTVD
jgi:hypothetical protein